eukprot:1924674-Rhodomonas_salina.1
MGAFKDIDEGGKGYISKEDVFKAASKHFGEDVAGIYVDNVMRAAGQLPFSLWTKVAMLGFWACRSGVFLVCWTGPRLILTRFCVHRQT